MAGTNSAIVLDPEAPENQSWEHWPKSAEVQGELGLTSKELLGYVNRGWFVRYRCPDSSVRLRPVDVESFRARMLDEERRAQVAEEQSATELKHVLRQAVSLLKQTQDHNARLWELHVKAPQTAITLLTDIVKDQRERIQQMEENADAAVRTREELLSLAHERELMTRDVEDRIRGRAQMREQGMAAVRDAAPALAEIIGKHFGIDLVSSPAKKLLDSLDPEMVKALVASGMLTPTQVALVKEIFPEIWAEAKPESEPQHGETKGQPRPRRSREPEDDPADDAGENPTEEQTE